MVSARSTSILLFIILLPLRFSSAHTQHQVKKRLVDATGCKLETARSSVNVEIYQGVPAVAETDQSMRFLLPGRKMLSRGVLSKKVVKSENGNIANGSTTKGNARCVIGKCSCNHEEGKGILNGKHKFSKRSGHYAKVKMSGLVPLNADYYVPRPHPPKNN